MNIARYLPTSLTYARCFVGTAFTAFLVAPSVSAAQETANYQYDALGRLTQVVSNRATVTTQYDPAGNRIQHNTATSLPVASCSFGVQDAFGNGEFSFDVVIQRTGTCTENVGIRYNTVLRPSGILEFLPQDQYKWFTIPGGGCSGTSENIIYDVSISVEYGSASISRGSGTITIIPNC